jgi:uncharacterized membrane protein
MEKENEVKETKANTPESGLNSNTAATLAYLVGFISGIYFLVTSKDPFVRFHAMQSTIVFAGFFILNIVLNYIPVIGVLLSPLLGLASLVLWIFLMMKAYKGEKYKLPTIGDIAEDQLAGKKK